MINTLRMAPDDRNINNGVLLAHNLLKIFRKNQYYEDQRYYNWSISVKINSLYSFAVMDRCHCLL